MLFVLIGLFLIGVGSYIAFENYGNKLEQSSNVQNKLYTGIYYASSDIVKVIEENDNDMLVQINNETYSFMKNGDIFENKETGVHIEFMGDNLMLYKGKKLIKTLEKK